MTDHCLCDYAGCIHEKPTRPVPTEPVRDEVELENIENHTERKWEEWTRRGEGR